MQLTSNCVLITCYWIESIHKASSWNFGGGRGVNGNNGKSENFKRRELSCFSLVGWGEVLFSIELLYFFCTDDEISIGSCRVEVHT